MSTDLTIYSAPMPDRLNYCKALAESNLLPRAYQRQPANVLLAVELGSALGIPPIQAINGIHVIEGKPTASADLIASLVRKAGHKLRVSGDDRSATATIIRADDPEFPFEVTWTMERARAAGLAGKGVWKQYPAAMLKARAITEAARAGASDALYGVIYTAEEIGHESPVPAPSERASIADLRAVTPPSASSPETAPSAESPVDAEVIEEEPPASKAQVTALNAAMTGMGLRERGDKLLWLSDQIGRTVASSKEVTKAEASRVLDMLAAPAEELFGEEVEA